MIKAIFVSPQNIKGLDKSGANYLMVYEGGLNEENWQILKNLSVELSIAITAFEHGICPLDPISWKKLSQKIKQLLAFQPKTLWLDHFRFLGRWEDIKKDDKNKEHIYTSAHDPCPHCQGKNRCQEILKLAQKLRQQVPRSVKLGYFAVPITPDEIPKIYTELGQDHRTMGKNFDLSSPMLYHRMIKKPVRYISEYVKWLSNATKKPVLPIIQIKDMPDDLEDKMREEEITQAFKEATKPPSEGVAIFWWQHALEKNKTGIISQLFS